MASSNDHVAINMNNINNRRRSPRSTNGVESESADAEPLFETDLINNPKPPKSTPKGASEDNEPDDNVPYTPEARPGIDDAFFPSDTQKPEIIPIKPKPGDESDSVPNGVPRRRGSVPFPYAPDFQPGMIDIDGVPTQVPDVNAYQHKKTFAQGMMDLALLSANANQLRYVLESYRRHPFYYPSLIFISISLILQIGVGVGLILNSRYNVKDQREICKANRINNFTIIGIFIVTIVNVFISAFGVADLPAVAAA